MQEIKRILFFILGLGLGVTLALMLNVAYANDTTINYKGQPVPSAMAPSMSAFSQDVCGIGISGAVNGGVFSVAGGTMVTDTNCVKLKWAKFLHDGGLKVAAVSLACTADHAVWEAMEMSGSPCPIGGSIGNAARRAWFELHPEWYEKLYGKGFVFTSPVIDKE
jgi:hypothetical protein